jgi:hypothetical protein
MRKRFARRCRTTLVRVCLALSAFAAAAGEASPQTVTASQLKAGFLFSFARFVDWPAESLAAGAGLILCVQGDAAVEQSLAQWVKGREIGGHPVVVRTVRDKETARACHLLYSAGLDKQRAVELLEAVKGLPIFTVSDLVEFSRMGGTAHLFPESGRMRFAVNVESAQRSRLRLSSQLLALAKIVKDEPNAAGR